MGIVRCFTISVTYHIANHTDEAVSKKDTEWASTYESRTGTDDKTCTHCASELAA